MKCIEIIVFLFNRAFFTWVSQVTCICFGFAFLRQVIGLKILHHQSEEKPKPIVTCSRTFSRTSRQLHVMLWVLIGSLARWSEPFVTGQRYYFGFGLVENCSK